MQRGGLGQTLHGSQAAGAQNAYLQAARGRTRHSSPSGVVMVGLLHKGFLCVIAMLVQVIGIG